MKAWKAIRIKKVRELVRRNKGRRELPDYWRHQFNSVMPKLWAFSNNHELGEILRSLKKQGEDIRRRQSKLCGMSVVYYQFGEYDEEKEPGRQTWE